MNRVIRICLWLVNASRPPVLTPMKRAIRIFAGFVDLSGVLAGWVMFGQHGRFLAMFVTVLMVSMVADLIRLVGKAGPIVLLPEELNRQNNIPLVLLGAGMALAGLIAYIYAAPDPMILVGIAFSGGGAIFLLLTRHHRFPEFPPQN
jgi:hypothetical protein